ncbi:SusE domain-containing protein [Flavobacterium aquiphilum]|uniref:SusE domain-containing protein n=1 Tax=Flavobacterium aquiphilum TaxID=3003261 RepID=UPI002481317E|nr:SusE domain-containing protein [Flavobacterium aquiphilum]
MRNLTKAIIALFAVLAVSCTIDEVKDRAVIEPVGAPVLTAPTTGASYVLKPENAATQAERFTWTSANYGGPVEIEYTIEIDKKGNKFATVQSLGAIKAQNQLSVTVEAMNKAVMNLKATPFTPTDYDVRIKAITGLATPMYSNVINITISAYTTENPKLWMPGSYQAASGYGSDWTHATAAQLSASGFGKMDFEGYVNFAAAGSKYKYTTQANWDGTNYGAGATAGTISTTGGDINGPAIGYYRVEVDTEKLTQKLTATAWGIVGAATTGGWDNSTAMTYDKDKKVWTITATLKADDMKFRANNAWDINFGDDGADGILEYGAANIKVPSAGNYTVTLDLSKPRAYTYTLKKN